MRLMKNNQLVLIRMWCCDNAVPTTPVWSPSAGTYIVMEEGLTVLCYAGIILVA